MDQKFLLGEQFKIGFSGPYSYSLKKKKKKEKRKKKMGMMEGLNYWMHEYAIAASWKKKSININNVIWI